ncbi:hypothetical protein D1632_16755 [Chryseobacterium nematophagum]|uniref:Uncharacterized protein n=1 Tax=Chryseobacterium nematophagum TaxID=2305228 RepID=A0A3M7L7H2_9FLAO|nr:hypothetical protein [Chryseobacterium nematophagum]RMZ57955.1 hypothetical protein D1632_16755 [Chryseobacterium nematophagum]
MAGQEKKNLLNENILTEVKNIQKRFSDSIRRYDYKENSALYDEKYKSFYGEKLKDLKNLYQNIYDKETMIGKVETISEASSLTQVENSKQLQDLQKRFTTDFPVYLFRNYSEGIYRCNLSFTVDVDGKFKRVKYRGESGLEFNIISALFLYAIGGLEKPLLYKNTPIVENFSQPVVVRLE